MKCDSCKHKKFHSPGSWYSVAEGWDDPYSYEYCAKFHWVGDPIEYKENIPEEDPFINCENYEKIDDLRTVPI